MLQETTEKICTKTYRQSLTQSPYAISSMASKNTFSSNTTQICSLSGKYYKEKKKKPITYYRTEHPPHLHQSFQSRSNSSLASSYTKGSYTTQHSRVMSGKYYYIKEKKHIINYVQMVQTCTWDKTRDDIVDTWEYYLHNHLIALPFPLLITPLQYGHVPHNDHDTSTIRTLRGTTTKQQHQDTTTK